MDTLYNYASALQVFLANICNVNISKALAISMNANTFKMLILTICVVFALTATMLVAYFASKMFVNTELYKLEISDSKFDKIVILASGIILSSVIITLGVLFIGVISKCFFTVSETIFYSYTKLMFSFSAILIVGYTLVAPNHSHHRLMNVSDEEARCIQRESARIATVSFIITAISYPLIVIIKNPEYKMLFEFAIVVIVVCYYFIEMISFRGIISGIFKINHSQKTSMSAKLAAFVNNKLHYFALGGMLSIVFIDSANQKPDEFMIFTCLNEIYIFLISMFAFQGFVSFLINKFNKHIEMLNDGTRSTRYIENRTSNIIWICDIVIFSAYFLVLCMGISCLGFDIITYVIHNKVTTVLVVLFVTVLICKIYDEYKEELLENAAKDDRNHYEKLKVFIMPISVVFYLVVVATAFMVMLSNIGIDVTPVIVNFSLIISGIWWVTHEIIESFLKGVILMLERNISVGEFVQINGLNGTVERLSTRVMYLRDINGRVHTIPYSSIGAITNFSKEYSCHYDELLLSDAKDIDKAKEILIKVVDDMKNEGPYKDLIIGDVIINGISPFDLKGVKIAWCVKTKVKGVYVVQAAYEKLIKEFKKHKIKIPNAGNLSLNIN